MVPSKLILLIEDDPDYEQLVRAALANSGEAFELQVAQSLSAGLTMLDHFCPDVILLDLDLNDSSGYDTFLRVRERAHGTPVTILTASDDDQLALRAVDDGAQDYLVKSLLQPKLIARCLQMAMRRQHRHERRGLAQVIAFLGSKGGVGVSTVAMNVAALLSQNGAETALLELQSGRPGTAALFLETPPKAGLHNLLAKPPDAITESDLLECALPAVYGLRLLCAAPFEAGNQRLDVEHLRAILSAGRRAFAHLVLDLPSALDETLLEALQIADSTTLVVDREPGSLACGQRILEQIRSAVPQNRRLCLAVVDRSGLAAPVPLAGIKDQLKLHPLGIIPSAPPLMALSHSARTPLVLLCPEDPCARALVELAERLLPGRLLHAGAGRSASLNQDAWRAIPETLFG